MEQPNTIAERSKHTVHLDPLVSQNIQREFLNIYGSTHGAMQETLSRGAELALAELKAKATQTKAA
jgi:uncharacterized protein YbjQ (UPF0145 family)